MWETVRRVMATRERLTVDGRRPALHELADACHLEVPKVVECLRLAPGVISLETPLGDDQFTLGDLVDAKADVPEHIEVQGLFPEDVEPLLLELTAREADVIRMRFGLAPFDSTHTLDEIGKVFGVTRERIRQIESKAMTNLRHALTRQGHSFEFPETRKKRVEARRARTAWGITSSPEAPDPVVVWRSPWTRLPWWVPTSLNARHRARHCRPRCRPWPGRTPSPAVVAPRAATLEACGSVCS